MTTDTAAGDGNAGTGTDTDTDDSAPATDTDTNPANAEPPAPEPAAATRSAADDVEAAAPTTDPAAEGAPVAAPRRRARRRILALVLGGVGVLVIAGLGVAYGVLSAHYAPSTSVSAFLDQVVKGRSAEAVKLMSPKPTGNAGLVSDDVYGAAKHRVTSYQIESTKIRDTHAEVTVRLHADSGTWTQRFDLVASSHQLLWDVWTVNGGDLPKITLDDSRPTGVTITANGIAIQQDGSQYNQYFTLPGSYTFAVESDNSLVAADSHSVAIHSMGGGRSVKVLLRFRLSDDGIAAGRNAVDQFLDGCLAQSSLAPTGDCGFYVENDPTGTVSNILWSITHRPVVSFGDWEDNGWTVKTDTAGVFEMDGTYRGSKGHGDVAALFTSYDVQGYVDLKDGKIVFHSTYTDGTGGQPGSSGT